MGALQQAAVAKRDTGQGRAISHKPAWIPPEFLGQRQHYPLVRAELFLERFRCKQPLADGVELIDQGGRDARGCVRRQRAEAARRYGD
jgi:hypothetical protein